MEEVIVPALQSEGVVTDRGKLDNINKVILKDKIPISKEDINSIVPTRFIVKVDIIDLVYERRIYTKEIKTNDKKLLNDLYKTINQT
jgi:hypothetical protein